MEYSFGSMLWLTQKNMKLKNTGYWKQTYLGDNETISNVLYKILWEYRVYWPKVPADSTIKSVP